MRRGSPSVKTLALVAIVMVLGYAGLRWVLAQSYPLQYRTLLFRRAIENGLDPYLVAAVIRAESGFHPEATSRQGARGLMQIMPETGRWAAAQLRIPFDPASLYDPDYNIRIGCWYLRQLQDEFGGETVVALAAYNGGRGNVKKWLEAGHWTGEHDTIGQIPFPETRQYVSKVMSNYDWYRRIYVARR